MSGYSLDGRVVAITGSTGGLGSAVCRALIAKGARLALFDMNLDAVQEQAKELGTSAHGWEVNVRSMESIQTAMDEAAKLFGGIDIVIAGAGITAFEPLVCGDPNTFDRVIDINVNGVWRTFRAGVEHVVKRKGYLMAISSMAAFSQSPLQASYTGSKAAVWAICNSIRLELRHMDVGVGSVHPTFFHTPMMDQAFNSGAGNKIWKGNKSGIFKMVALEEVVSGIIGGIEKRSDMVFVPKSNSLVAHAPRFFRKVVESREYKDHEVAAMIMAAKQEAAAR
jgi:NAD(P)-dependent dehydrogenase (short-subunit alcohol dehydrogenase family)